MALKKVLLSTALIFCHLISASNSYYNELKDLKNSSEAKMIFEDETHPGLRKIQQDILKYKNLPLTKRIDQFLTFLFSSISMDLVLVSRDTMPQLYTYVESVCEKGNIVIPTLYITRSKWFLNAFAIKLFRSKGFIVIGQELMKKMSDEALEGVIAHELGHVKYNHSNKNFALWAARYVVKSILLTQFVIEKDATALVLENESYSFYNHRFYLKRFAIGKALSILQAFVINKRFEKEADEFACKVAGKSEGLIEFFEYAKEKEQQADDDFPVAYAAIRQNKGQLLSLDYARLLARYYAVKAGHVINKGIRYLYHHTPLGAHPCHQDRIDAAKAYLAQKEA